MCIYPNWIVISRWNYNSKSVNSMVKSNKTPHSLLKMWIECPDSLPKSSPEGGGKTRYKTKP